MYGVSGQNLIDVAAVDNLNLGRVNIVFLTMCFQFVKIFTGCQNLADAAFRVGKGGENSMAAVKNQA